MITKRILALAAFLMTSLAQADSYTMYYFGEARRTNFGWPDDTVPLLVKKVVDVEAGHITELGTTLNDRTHKIFDSTMKIKISGEALSVTNDDGSVVGVGEAKGRFGYWNFLRIEMVLPAPGIRIVDDNYIDSLKNRLVARKKIFKSDGTILQLWDGEFLEISEQQYLQKYKELHEN